MSHGQALPPSEREFLESYARGADPAHVLADLVHDTRGAWKAETRDGDVVVRHHTGAEATLRVHDGVVASISWHDAPEAAVGRARADAIDHVASTVATVFDCPLLRAVIGRSCVGTRREYAPDLAEWAVRSVLARLAEDAGAPERAARLRALELAPDDDAGSREGVIAALAGFRDAVIESAGNETAHYLGAGRSSPLFPRRLLALTGEPRWAAFALVATALGAHASTDLAILYPLATFEHGVVWIESPENSKGAEAQPKPGLRFAEGTLRTCLAALPAAARGSLLRALPAIRGQRRGRLSVPHAPHFEPTPRLGSHAVVGDELWLSAPQGIAVRALPELDRVREIALPVRADAIAVSADRRIAAVHSSDLSRGQLTICDAQSGEILAELEAGRSPREPAVSARGRFVALASATGSSVWELDGGGRPLHPQPRMYSGLVAFTHDESALVCGTQESIVLRSLAANEAPRTLLATGWFVSALACAPDGSAYAAAFAQASTSARRVVRIDAATGDTRVLWEQRQDVMGLAFSPRGDLAIAGDAAVVFDRHGRMRRRLAAPRGRVAWWGDDRFVVGWARPAVVDARTGLTLAAYGAAPGDGELLATLAFAGDVIFTEAGCIGERVRKAWDLASGVELGPPPTIERSFLDPTVTPDGRSQIVTTMTRMESVVMGDRDPVESALDLVRDGAVVRRLCEHADAIGYRSLSRDGAFALSVGGGEVRLSSLTAASSVSLARDLEVVWARFDAEERAIALCGNNRAGASEARLVTFDGEVRARAAGPVERVAGHGRAGVLVVARPNGLLDVVRGDAVVATHAFHRSGVKELVVSPCGTLVAAADFDNAVCVHAVTGPGVEAATWR